MRWAHLWDTVNSTLRTPGAGSSLLIIEVASVRPVYKSVTGQTLIDKERVGPLYQRFPLGPLRPFSGV